MDSFGENVGTEFVGLVRVEGPVEFCDGVVDLEVGEWIHWRFLLMGLRVERRMKVQLMYAGCFNGTVAAYIVINWVKRFRVTQMLESLSIFKISK